MKVTKKKSIKKSSGKKDKLSQEDSYLATLDLITWWESFNGDCLENGNVRYKTIWSFIIAKTKIQWQRAFLYWILGPIGTSDKYKKFDQFDWETKRKNGKWYASPESDRLSKELKSKANALEAMKTVGHVNVSFINRIEALLKELDDEYSGRLFLPSLTAKENTMRAATYFKLLEQAQGMMGQAQIMFGRTHGIDLERLDQFFSMLSQGMGQAASTMGFAGSNTVDANPASHTMKRILDMVVTKAAERELDLPDKQMEDIVVSEMSPKLVKGRVN